MVARLALGVLLVLAVPVAAPRHRVRACGGVSRPSGASPAFSRRPSSDDTSGEFVHAIVYGAPERPLGIVRA
ncbi:MAG TPA: hypothetical protein VKH46_06820 [Thermoanaerobaculia bacterium]|nr:hypothetical protein [Thermoanaerobaculia bacterium]